MLLQLGVGVGACSSPCLVPVARRQRLTEALQRDLFYNLNLSRERADLSVKVS